MTEMERLGVIAVILLLGILADFEVLAWLDRRAERRQRKQIHRWIMRQPMNKEPARAEWKRLIEDPSKQI